MKNKIVISLFVCLFFFLFSLQVHAQTETPTPTSTSSSDSSVASQLNNKIKELESKVAELKSQGDSLASKIGVLDNQITLTEYRINATQQEINDLEKDIGTASKRMTNLEGSLTDVSKVLINRIIATYKIGLQGNIVAILASGDISNFIARANYLRIVQEHDKKLLVDTQQAKNDYANQKTIFEDKKTKVLGLKTQLESYTEQLDKDKKDKESLLVATKNSEKEYQSRLAAARRELRQIQGAAKALIATESRHVNRGEVIGYMGNTGYSFGAHLHFGLYNVSKLEDYDYYSNHENPANSLEARSVDWYTGCEPRETKTVGSGSFAWPMDTGDLHISQGYGHTCYSNTYYNGNPHPAFDMYGPLNSPVYAVESGEAYFCRNCTGDGGNGVFIFHSNGKMSLYWHLQ